MAVRDQPSKSARPRLLSPLVSSSLDERKAMNYILVIVAGLTLAQFSFTEEQANLAQRFFKIPGDTAIRVRTKNEISSEPARARDEVQLGELRDVVLSAY